MNDILFDDKAKKDDNIQKEVGTFLKEVNTLETDKKFPVIIFQDGKSGGYYIKCKPHTK